jgi:hypothetical protein
MTGSTGRASSRGTWSDQHPPLPTKGPNLSAFWSEFSVAGHSRGAGTICVCRHTQAVGRWRA